jgi:hypothetical protein
LVLDNHVLVGTMLGNIAFFNPKDFSEKELSPRLHNGLIYELVDFGKRNRSHNVISLSGDSSLKIWNVSEMNFTENSSTLFF